MALATIGLSTALGDFAAAAPAGDGEIVITARRRPESARDAPLSATVRAGAELEAAGVQSLSSLIPSAPNASLAGGIGGQLQGLTSLRGVSSLVRVVGVESGLGVYVDGVFMGRPDTFDQDLVGVERVEVLRGPQATFFGRNAIAGVVNIVTITPGESVRAVAQLDLGEYELARVQGYISGKIAPRLYGSISFNRTARDGYVRHVSGGRDLEALDYGAFRGALRFAPNPAFDLTLAGDGLTDRGHPVFFEVADANFIDDPSETSPFTTHHGQDNDLHRDVWGASLTARGRRGSGEWTSVTAYREASFDAALDDDKLPVRFVEDTFGDDTRLFSQEIRYASPAYAHVRYVAGASYFYQNVESFRPFAIGEFLTGMPGVTFPITLTSAARTEAYDAFANVDIAASEVLSFSLGARATHERREGHFVQDDPIANLAPDITYRGVTEDVFFSPTASVSYIPAPAALIYGRYARGFKSAGFNTDFTQSLDDLSVRPEIADTIEVGFKRDYAGGAGFMSAAVFTSDYRDLQVAQIVGNAVVLRNAASADIWGAEFETSYAGDRWRASLGLGYLDARYSDFPDCPAPGGAGPSEVRPNCADNALILAPRWTGSAMVEHAWPWAALGGEVFARAEVQYQSEIFFEPQNTPRLGGDPRTVVNVRIGARMDDWELAGWINNATDELYVAYADDRSAIQIPLTRAYGAPRLWGVSLRRRF